MKTNETVFGEIIKNGVITKQQLFLLKNRSNKEQRDVINYGFIEKCWRWLRYTINSRTRSTRIELVKEVYPKRW